jgi:tetratricopeptide (TPR) repeat protein
MDMANRSHYKRTVCISAASLLFVCLILFANPLPAQEEPHRRCAVPPELQRKVSSNPTAAGYDALGAYFGQSDNYACAIPAFRSSLELDPKSWRTHSYLGLALLASGDAVGAVDSLQTSLHLKPDQPKTHMTLGAALVQLNQLDPAIEQFRAVLKADANSVTALDWLAKALVSQERYAAAIAVLKDAPPDQILQMDLVVAYSKNRKNDQAIRLLSRMIRQHPRYAPAHFGLGTIYMQQNRLVDAAAEFKEALRLNPRDGATCVSYAKTLVLMSDFKLALPVVQRYLRDRPTDFEPHYLLGVVDRELGRFTEAKGALEEAVRLNPEHFDSRYNLGVVLAQLGDLGEARPQFEKALELDPSSDEVRFRLGNLLRSMGLQEEASRQFTIFQNHIRDGAKKDVATNKANQAAQFLASGDVQRAVDLYREAVEQDPRNSHMRYDLALALDRQGAYASEKDTLQEALEIDPGFALAHNQVGFLEFQSGQVAEAEKEYKSAILLNPHYAEAKSNLGSLYGQLGNDAEAERMFREALDDDPGYVEAYVNLAVVLASRAQFDQAQLVLQKAIRLDPGNEHALEVRSQIEAHLAHPGKMAKP